MSADQVERMLHQLDEVRTDQLKLAGEVRKARSETISDIRELRQSFQEFAEAVGDTLEDVQQRTAKLEQDQETDNDERKAKAERWAVWKVVGKVTGAIMTLIVLPATAAGVTWLITDYTHQRAVNGTQEHELTGLKSNVEDHEQDLTALDGRVDEAEEQLSNIDGRLGGIESGQNEILTAVREAATTRRGRR